MNAVENAEPIRPQVRLVAWNNADHPRKDLRFSLAVPADAVCGRQARHSPNKKHPIVDLACFRMFDSEAPLEIIVQAAALEHEVALRDYYQLWSKFGGEEILESVLLDGDTDRPSLLLARKHTDGQVWITRRTGYKVWQGSCGWVISVNVACQEDRLPATTTLMQEIAQSLTPVEPPEHRLAESLRLVTRAEPVDFATYLPMSWQEQPHHHDMSGITRFCFLKQLRGEISGVFSIVAAGKAVFPESCDFIREAVSIWEPFGISPQAITFKPTANLGKAQTVCSTLTLPTRDRSVPDARTLELLLADFGSHWFHAEVFGPSPEQDFEAWAINHRALDIFARQFRHA